MIYRRDLVYRRECIEEGDIDIHLLPHDECGRVDGKAKLEALIGDGGLDRRTDHALAL